MQYDNITFLPVKLLLVLDLNDKKFAALTFQKTGHGFANVDFALHG